MRLLLPVVVALASALVAGCASNDEAPPDFEAHAAGDAAPPPPSPMVDDRGAATALPPCPCFVGEGAYCGRAVESRATKAQCAVAALEGHTNDVLACKGGVWSVSATCADGCFMAPTGQDDGCHVQKPVYHLPWPCGTSIPVTQGNDGDVCAGFTGDHVGYMRYAFDFGTPRGTPVLAARAGVVTQVVNAAPPGSACNDGCPQPFGTAAFDACCNACISQANWVDVAHGDGTVATYWHLDRIAVAVGQTVAQGATLGLSGTSGCSSGPHLHFQVMGDCPTSVCTSIPLTFDEAGAPACGFSETSANGCSESQQ